MPPPPSAAKQEDRAPHHHFAAMLEKGIQHVAQIDGARLAVHQRHAIDAEHRLQLRLRVEIVQHHFAVFAASQLDHHAQAVLVRFVADLGDALDALFLHQFGDLLDHARLVDLVGQFLDDDHIAVAVALLHVGASANVDAASPGSIRPDDSSAAIDDGASGKVRAADVLQQIVHGEPRVFQQRQAAVHHFGEIVRRNVGGHADGDAVGAVDQQVRHLGGQDLGDGEGLVVVQNRIDRFLVQIRQQFGGNRLHSHFGVALMRWRIAIHGAEVALALHQHVAHVEVLRQADDGFVDRAVAVGVVLGDHVSHHVGGLPRRTVVDHAQLVHRVEHAAMHGFQTVAHIRQRTGDDYAHRVVEIRLAKLVFYASGQNLPFRSWRLAKTSFNVGHGRGGIRGLGWPASLTRSL